MVNVLTVMTNETRIKVKSITRPIYVFDVICLKCLHI